MALARSGDADEANLGEIVSWALDLRADIDQIAAYSAGQLM
jgi:hypothetical protein